MTKKQKIILALIFGVAFATYVATNCIQFIHDKFPPETVHEHHIDGFGLTLLALGTVWTLTYYYVKVLVEKAQGW